ncbi:uncharacterized protein [Littorina saxatilis]|uniref:Uncharacterized protein n=1 Tax=Littorina saxatilis TaxID=31220 RepID=A0AAN9AVC7_9CAEN
MVTSSSKYLTLLFASILMSSLFLPHSSDAFSLFKARARRNSESKQSSSSPSSRASTLTFRQRSVLHLLTFLAHLSPTYQRHLDEFKETAGLTPKTLKLTTNRAPVTRETVSNPPTPTSTLLTSSAMTSASSLRHDGTVSSVVSPDSSSLQNRGGDFDLQMTTSAFSHTTASAAVEISTVPKVSKTSPRVPEVPSTTLSVTSALDTSSVESSSSFTSSPPQTVAMQTLAVFTSSEESESEESEAVSLEENVAMTTEMVNGVTPTVTPSVVATESAEMEKTEEEGMTTTARDVISTSSANDIAINAEGMVKEATSTVDLYRMTSESPEMDETEEDMTSPNSDVIMTTLPTDVTMTTEEVEIEETQEEGMTTPRNNVTGTPPTNYVAITTEEAEIEEIEPEDMTTLQPSIMNTSSGSDVRSTSAPADAITTTEEAETDLEETTFSMSTEKPEIETEDEENLVLPFENKFQCSLLEGVCLLRCENPSDVIWGISCGNDVSGRLLVCCDD